MTVEEAVASCLVTEPSGREGKGAEHEGPDTRKLPALGGDSQLSYWGSRKMPVQ